MISFVTALVTSAVFSSAIIKLFLHFFTKHVFITIEEMNDNFIKEIAEINDEYLKKVTKK